MIEVKGIALNTIVYTLMALAVIVILISILNSIIPNFIGRSFCKFYKVILTLPLPKQLKFEIPGCSIFPSMERVSLNQEKSTPIVLANYIDNCWEKSNEGKTGMTFICYEIFMKKIEVSFDEQNITSELKNQDKINWKIGIIEGEDLTVIIKYNSISGQVEVI